MKKSRFSTSISIWHDWWSVECCQQISTAEYVHDIQRPTPIYNVSAWLSARRYRRRPTRGVINELTGRNLLWHSTLHQTSSQLSAALLVAKFNT